MDGNFNIQVLQEALSAFGAEVTSWKSKRMLQDIGSQDNVHGIIFNSSTHWFAIRRVNNIWFNLNSTNSLPGPQIITDFYLSAFIESTYEMKFTNFVVTNLPNLPELASDIYKQRKHWQRLVDIKDVLSAKKKPVNIEDSDSEQLRKALEMSKKDIKGSRQEDLEFDQIIKLTAEQGTQNYEDKILEDDLQRMIEESKLTYLEEMARELPEEPKEGCEVMFKYKSENFTRIFSWDANIAEVKLYVQIHLKDNGLIVLRQNYPTKMFDNDEETVKESGIENKTILFVEVIN